MNAYIAISDGTTEIVVSPKSCTITRAVCNKNLQHVENSCSVLFTYDPDLLALFIKNDSVNAVIRDDQGNELFTGTISTEVSWKDMGRPFPIDTIPVLIKDYTGKLQKNTSEEIALINTTFASVLQRICIDCGLSYTNALPAISIPAFVIRKGRQYLSVLNAFCFQYGFSFYFDNFGVLSLFNFKEISDSPEVLGEFSFLNEPDIKKSAREYTGVKATYNTLKTVLNGQVYFEHRSYNSAGTATVPSVLVPGDYYPLDATPIVEADEGQLYQSFDSGYAVSKTKYNGEIEFGQSANTELLYTSNHQVVATKDASIIIDRAIFESLRASVRFRNTGLVDANLNLFTIRADSIYREAEATVITGNDNNPYELECEFVYDAITVEAVSKVLYQFFSKGNYSISFRLEEHLAAGSYRTLDLGLSGFVAPVLILASTLDCETDVYSFDSISIKDATLDVSRIKTQRPGSSGEFDSELNQIYEIGNDLLDRPSYTEVVSGFTKAGATTIPVQLILSAAGSFRSIVLNCSKQQSLSNFLENQFQCSEDAMHWFAPVLDGSGVNGHGAIEGAFFSTPSTMLVHPKIPPAGTIDEPTGRLLYYRVRQRTRLDSLSEWSTVVAATTTLNDTGDYAANSISVNALMVSEFAAVFARLSSTLLINPVGGLAASDGDTQTILNAKELLFQLFRGSSWSTLVRLGIEGLMANQIYSPHQLVITNDDMAGRRAKGYDFGLPYLSENSRVIHYDSDLLDQKGEVYFEMAGSGALVGKDDGITPAIIAVAPYATEARSLYGNFRLRKDIGITNTFTVDFWIKYSYNENQEIFRVGSESEYVSVEIQNAEPLYNSTGTPKYNSTASGGVWYNTIRGAVARVVRSLNGVTEVVNIVDPDGKPGLMTGNWYHVGIIDTRTSVFVIINSTVFEFTSPSARTEPVVIDINRTMGLFLVDEVLIDPSVAETPSAFIANTTNKKPWAALSDVHDWAILSVKDPAYFRTDVFKSPDFKPAVRAYLEELNLL